MPGLLNIFPKDVLDQNQNKVHDSNTLLPKLKGMLYCHFFTCAQKK